MTLFTHDATPGVGGGAGLGAESEFMALALRGGTTLFWSVARGQLPMTDKVELALVKSTFAQNIQPKLLKIKQSHQPERAYSSMPSDILHSQQIFNHLLRLCD